MTLLGRIRSRLQRQDSTPMPARTAQVPPGHRVYAVGDIHGRADLLDRMAELVAADLRGLEAAGADPDGEGSITATAPVAQVTTVFLGDYVDRGPASREVVERLATGDWPTPLVALLGNHELMCLQFLRDATHLPRWRSVGGLSTLASYGVEVSALMGARSEEGHVEAARQALSAAMSPRHLAFLTEGLEPCATIGDYFFCHAGVRPGVPLDRQDPLDLITIRDEFLGSEADFGKVVVHGHTPGEDPVFKSNRIGIDTGAYATNHLTCLVLDEDRVEVLQTR
ncbi:MAG: metallophosphoesterase family protein [Burkholderiales bacterium]|nr:metallophosphoesterase family protein [Burkholderiales bacterium]